MLASLSSWGALKGTKYPLLFHVAGILRLLHVHENLGILMPMSHTRTASTDQSSPSNIAVAIRCRTMIDYHDPRDDEPCLSL